MRTRAMAAQGCLAPLREMCDVTFSTVDERGCPLARVIDVMGAGEGHVTFRTARGKDFYVLVALVIDGGALVVLDPAGEPIFRRSFSLGGVPVTRWAFLMGDDCVGCDTCGEGYLQQCIDEGEPYRINQGSCLHCGPRYENCPVAAIERRWRVQAKGGPCLRTCWICWWSARAGSSAS